jgi:outer membrane protein TolC
MSAQQVTIARAQRLPDISLTSQYGQVFFGGLVPKFGDFRDNWSIGAALQIPIFTGGRISADVADAHAGVVEAEARLEQAAGLAILDARNTVAQLRAAVSIWEASQGTVEQAERAYAIAELRFLEGISTQLELTDARILLEQARANHATAARDLQVAQTRAELLPYLPIAIGGGTGMPGGALPAAGAASTGGAATTSAGAGAGGQPGAFGGASGQGSAGGSGGFGQ